MGKQTARQRKKQTPPATRPPTTSVNDIPDNLLDDFLGCLDSHVDAIRAAAVCTRWRRIASTRGAYYDNWNYHDFSTTIGHYHVVDPSFTPGPGSRSLQAQSRRRRRVVFVPASPSIDARHFALDFLPSGPGCRHGDWELVDGHGSLLLLTNQRRRGLFPADLVVCEPISRRYVRVQPFENAKYSGHCLGVFLDNGYGCPVGMSSFSLTCVLHEHAAGFTDGMSVVTARVYRHERPSRWCRRKYGWSSPRRASSGGLHLWGSADSARYVGRSRGSIFWAIEDDGTVLAVREGTGALSLFRLPEHVVHGGSQHRSTTFRFIDDGMDNNLAAGVVSLTSNDLRVFKQEHEYGGEWVPVRSLGLREATRGLPGYKECFFGHTPKIVTAGKGYVVLTPAEGTWLFSVELETMQVEREHSRNRLAGDVYPYELWLPPRVRVCVPRCERGHHGMCYRLCQCKQAKLTSL